MTMTIVPSPHLAPPPTSRKRTVVIVVAALATTAAGITGVMIATHTSPTTVASAVTAGGTATAADRRASTPLPATVPQSAAALFASSTVAALAQRWVHIEMTASKGSVTATYSDDDGPTSGIQRMTTSKGNTTVIVVGGATYLTGDSKALAQLYGFRPTLSRSLAGRWIRLLPGDPGYQGVTAAVTLPSAIDQLTLAGPLVLLPARTLNGQQVVGIRGVFVTAQASTGASATLWVTAAAPHLPVAFDATNGSGHETITFSRWGAAVPVAAPATWWSRSRATAA